MMKIYYDGKVVKERNAILDYGGKVIVEGLYIPDKTNTYDTIEHCVKLICSKNGNLVAILEY